jgi:hypothetical protein
MEVKIFVFPFKSNLKILISPIGNGLSSRPIRLQYLFSSFFTSPVIAISGNFQNLCSSQQNVTLCFWWPDDPENIVPICNSEFNPNVTSSYFDPTLYKPIPLTPTEVITDQTITPLGVIFSAINEIDLVHPSPPYVLFYSPNSSSTSNWMPSITALDEESSSCRLCSIRFPDSARISIDIPEDESFVILNLANYPASPAVYLQTLAPKFRDNHTIFTLFTMFYAEITSLVENEDVTIVGGMFGSYEANYTNLIYRKKNGSWRNVGSHGIDNGVINALILVGDTLYIGGLFTITQTNQSGISNIFYSLTSISHISNGLSQSKFEPFPGFTINDYISGEVACFAYSHPYLFVGGSFTFQTTLPNGTKTKIQNFAIWNITGQHWIINAGFG